MTSVNHALRSARLPLGTPPKGLRNIAKRVHTLTAILRAGVVSTGHEVASEEFFDTLTVKVNRKFGTAKSILAAAELKGCVK